MNSKKAPLLSTTAQVGPQVVATQPKKAKPQKRNRRTPTPSGHQVAPSINNPSGPEHTGPPAGQQRSFTLNEWCEMRRVSRGLFYKMKGQGIAPRFMHVGAKVLITDEADREWCAGREAATAQPEVAPT